jgi:hypothetical protein
MDGLAVVADPDGLAVVADPDDARRWRVTGPDPERVSAVNAYLGYLADRNYSPCTVRTYGYGLLAFVRWLASAELTIDAVATSDVLDFLAACGQETVKGRPGPNVLDLNGHRRDRLAPASINLRLAAVTGLYEYRAMSQPGGTSPIPKGRPSSWFAPGERSGLLAHTKRRPAPRSRLRVRTPRGCRGRWTPARWPVCSVGCAPAGTWRWPG